MEQNDEIDSCCFPLNEDKKDLNEIKNKKLNFKIFYNGYIFKKVKLKPLTCGLIIENNSGWFLGHVSGEDYWDLPKGKMETNEDPKQAAIRECLEETGLDLSSYIDRFEDLGTEIYNKKMGKSLKLFKVNVEDDFDLSNCHCKTNEMDNWGFYPKEDVLLMVNRRMGKQLLKRGLLYGEIRVPKKIKKIKAPVLLKFEFSDEIFPEAKNLFKNRLNKI